LAYFISHLRYDAGRIFFFYFVYIGLFLTTSIVGQFIAILNDSIENAGLLFSTFVIFNAISAGFLLPRHDIPVWWIWGYWSSYIQYGIQSLTIDQLQGMKFSCPNNVGAVKVPLQDGTFQFYCQFTSGDDIMNQFDMNPNLKWGGAGAVYGFYFLFIILALLGLRFVNHSKR